MLKKLGIPMLALAGMLAVATPKAADAKVHVGVAIGVPPVYPYPYCSAYDPGCAGYVYPYGYTPYVYGGFGWHGHHDWHGHEHHEFRAHHR
jgi:hypothetical protein